MVDMSAEIDNQIDAYNHMKDEIEAAIDTVHDLTLQTLLGTNTLTVRLLNK
jgi:hypothetical protein